MNEETLRVLDNEISLAISRGEIIGGVRDPRTGTIVPVDLVEIELEGEVANDYKLYSYKSEDGAELALLAHVMPGRRTREWRLTEEAGKAGYQEVEIPVMGGGDGLIYHGLKDGAHATYRIATSADEPQAHVAVSAGESFMFEANPDSHLGAWVLSLVSREFQLAYEEVARGSTSEESTGTTS